MCSNSITIYSPAPFPKPSWLMVAINDYEERRSRREAKRKLRGEAKIVPQKSAFLTFLGILAIVTAMSTGIHSTIMVPIMRSIARDEIDDRIKELKEEQLKDIKESIRDLEYKVNGRFDRMGDSITSTMRDLSTQIHTLQKTVEGK